ncbi:MAG TPA: hypothetical protein VL625_11260 [Patescibacteria group bacterium]|nr:hypothetical protein [Patescibacteria group bacterium]
MPGDDDIFDPANLRKAFKEQTSKLTDDQLRDYVRKSLTDEDIKKTLMAAIPDLMEDAKKSGKYSPAELEKYKNQLVTAFSKPEVINSTREKIVNDPRTLARLKEALANPTDENIRKMHDELQKSWKVAIANAVLQGCNKGYVDAGFWGITAGAQFSVEALGSTSRLAKFLSLGRATPGVAVGVAIVEGLFAAKDFRDGHAEEGAKKLGGSIGGLAGTLAAGAATVGVLATAPGWVPVAVAGAIGVACYYEGRAIGQGVYAIYETHKIYKELDEKYQPDPTRFSNLKPQIACMLVQNPELRKQFAAMGVKTVPTNNPGTENWINIDNFAAAMVDPKIGEAVTAKLRDYLNQKKAGYEKIRDDNDHWYESRYFCFTDHQRDEQQKYELNKMWAREMNSALIEVDGFRGATRKQLADKAEAAAKARADLQKHLEPFNKLDAGVKACIIASLEKNYPDYKAKNGDKAMDHDMYLMANEAAIAEKPDVLKIFQEANEKIKYVAAQQLDEWKQKHASATQAELNHQKDALEKALREESLNSPQSFQAKFDHYKQLEAQKAETKPETKPEARTAFTNQASISTTTAPVQSVSTETPAPQQTEEAAPVSSGGIFSTLTNAFRAAAACKGNILEKAMTFLSALFSSAASGETDTRTTTAPTRQMVTGNMQPRTLMV